MSQPTKTYKIAFFYTLLSRLSHGGESTGTNRQVLNRCPFVQEDSTVEEVPVVSGNSLRGILRDTANKGMLSLLGNPTLSEAAVNFLFSGGGLTKGESSSVLRIGEARKLRKALPTVSLFGGGVGNMIMEGKISVTDAIPLCEETKRTLDGYAKSNPALATALEAMPLTTIYSLLDEAGMTRRDDLKRESIRGYLGDDEDAGEIGETAPPKSKASLARGETKEEKVAPTQMRFHVETLSPGTRLYSELLLRDVTEIEYAAFLAALFLFAAEPYLGGKSGVGFGRVDIEPLFWGVVSPGTSDSLRPLLESMSAPALAPIQQATTPDMPEWVARYQKFVEDNRTEMLALLGGVK